MQNSNSSSYKQVRSIARGLEILRALNHCESGRSSSSDLALRTGLHRTTVRRLLETLAAEGYVRKSNSDDRFQLTLKVRELSEGFTDAQWISTIASPVMGSLLPKVVWPSDLSLPDGECMRVRETTHRFSPLSFHRAMVGRRLPMLVTASGKAYLAHCNAQEREQILQLLRTSPSRHAILAADHKYIEALLAQVQRQGYGTNEGEWNHEAEKGKIGAIAVPILHGGVAVASLSVIYLLRAVNREEAVSRYYPLLREAVNQIETGLSAHTGNTQLP